MPEAKTVKKKVDLHKFQVVQARADGVDGGAVMSLVEETVYGELHRTHRAAMARAYVDPAGARPVLQKTIQGILYHEKRLHEGEKALLSDRILNDCLGMGILEPLRVDRRITDISVLDWDKVHVVLEGDRYLAGIRYPSPNAWESFAKRLVATSLRDWTEESPMVLFQMEDGMRVRLMRPPLTSAMVATMRKAQSTVAPVTAPVMIQNGTLSAGALAFLEWAVIAGCSIICAGEIGAGKTTTLRVLLGMLRSLVRGRRPVRTTGGIALTPAPPMIHLLEHTREIDLNWSNLVSIEAVERRELGIDLAQAMQGVLQQNAQWIVFGEILGPEADPAIDAALSGHPVLLTIHAGSAREALDRLTTAALKSGSPLSPERVAAMAHRAFDLAVEHHWQEDAQGRARRRITAVTEVTDDGRYRDIFRRERGSLARVGNLSPGLAAKVARRTGREVPREWLNTP